MQLTKRNIQWADKLHAGVEAFLAVEAVARTDDGGAVLSDEAYERFRRLPLRPEVAAEIEQRKARRTPPAPRPAEPTPPPEPTTDPRILHRLVICQGCEHMAEIKTRELKRGDKVYLVKCHKQPCSCGQPQPGTVNLNGDPCPIGKWLFVDQSSKGDRSALEASSARPR